MNRKCPNCGSKNHVSRELGRNGAGRLDMFAPDSTIFTCNKFGPPTDRGCGHRWDERHVRADKARQILQAALIQMTDSDDEIVRRRIQEAALLLEARI